MTSLGKYVRTTSCLVLWMAAGCVAGDANAPPAGAVRMELITATGGTSYRLHNARFAVTGQAIALLDSETQPGATVLTTPLVAGAYSIDLQDGWDLQRSDEGTFVPIQATLVSTNPAAFQIAAGGVTNVAYRFLTDGGVITVGSGTLNVSVEVSVADASAGGTGDGGAGAGGAASFTPRSLGSRLAIWLNDTQIVADPNHGIISWGDSSGQVPANAANSVAGRSRPTVVANGLSGHDVALFAMSTVLEIADAPSLQWKTGDFAYALVVRSSATIGLYRSANLFSAVEINQGTADVSLAEGLQRSQIVSLAGVSPGVFHVLVARRIGHVLEIRVDGVSATGAQEPNLDSGSSPQIGITGQGEIAEIIAVNGTLADADLANVEGYLRAKFGL